MGPAMQAAIIRGLLLDIEELIALDGMTRVRLDRAKADLAKVRRGEWP